MKKAVELYRKAAAQEYASAQYNLGVCYELGKGIKKNMKIAVELYRKAAAQGEDRAMQALEEPGEKE
jgi:TPR repeat protein